MASPQSPANAFVLEILDSFETYLRAIGEMDAADMTSAQRRQFELSVRLREIDDRIAREAALDARYLTETPS